jgi:HK97 family phage major capsid protein
MTALKPEYAADAVWVMSRSALAAVQRLKDGSGRFLWQPSLSEGRSSTLLGAPVVVVEAMPALVPGDASVSVAYGSFKAGYCIVDHGSVHMMRDPYSAKPYVEFYTTRRVGGDVVDFDAVKLLKAA